MLLNITTSDTIKMTFKPYVWNKREYGEERTEVGDVVYLHLLLNYATCRDSKNHIITKIVVNDIDQDVNIMLKEFKEFNKKCIENALSEIQNV